MIKRQRFPIGLQFVYHGDRKGQRTITDVLTTTNSKGEVVRVEYHTVRLFAGRGVVEVFSDTSIARSLPPEQLRQYVT